MSAKSRCVKLFVWAFVLVILSGCRAAATRESAPAGFPVESVSYDEFIPEQDMPRELSKAVMPAYTIEPPDILEINTIHIVPKSPYMLRTSDLVLIEVQGTFPDSPIAGPYSIEADGLINLGIPYGSVKISGNSTDQAKTIIQKHLATRLKDPIVSVTILETAAQQQISAQHLVGPDGTVTLGVYGSVSVVGKTVAEAKLAIEAHLSKFFDSPEVSVDVFAYNSKVYYIITEGAGLGDGVYRFPVTGNETVLDAISNISGLDQVSSKRIWIARPTPNSDDVQILPVDWKGVTAQASTGTNYQIFPGDRVFVAEDKLVAFDTGLGKLTAPLERLMGFVLLGTGTATRLSGKVLQGGGNTRNSGTSF